MELTIRLNGTSENPYHKLGTTCNPFSQIADAQYDKYVMQVQQLGADPIPDTDFIRKHLQGFSQEFIDLLCRRFEKGKMVEFRVKFNE
jgi:hypothetical protein